MDYATTVARRLPKLFALLRAGLIARELPSAEVLASWQHIEQRALDLRAAGLDGTLDV